MTEQAKCALCGEPMPEGEQMFKYHGYSGPCPKPPLKQRVTGQQIAEGMANAMRGRLDAAGAPKLELTVLERECLKLLGEIQMRGDRKYFQIPHEISLRIEAVLMMANQRRLGA